MTIISSAVRNGLDVAAYVEDLLNPLLAGNQDYRSLRPDVWAQTLSESIGAYRQRERQQHDLRRDRKRLFWRLARLSQ